MRALLPLVLLLGCSAGLAPSPGPPPSQPVEHPQVERYAAALAAHVDSSGRVDYAALSRDRGDLDAYYRSVAHLSPKTYEGWSTKRRLAFWINVYNAGTLQVVLENAPEQSIREIPGVWDSIELQVMGRARTLDAIEHSILRVEFEEPRIHLAINCASVGCPPLRREPYVAERLSVQLDDQSRRFLSDPQNFRIDRATGVVWLSPIFDWFGEDFSRDGSDQVRAVLAFVSRYLDAEDAEYLRTGRFDVEWLGYDWRLNRK